MPLRVSWLPMHRWMLLCLTVSALFGDNSPPLPVERLAREAELVVHGRVASKTIHRDAAKRVLTALDVKVLEVWKGSWKESSIPVMHGGGILGEHGVRIIGQADYEPGEEVVLFLTPNHEGQYVTVGMSWGKFAVTRQGETRLARQVGVAQAPAIPLPELRAQIQQSLEQ